MRYYNRLENEILARLMNVLNDGFKEMGMCPSSGPMVWTGASRAKRLKNQKVTTAEQIQQTVPYWFLEAARMSYLAVGVEIMMPGIVPGESHESDINSAYPYIHFILCHACYMENTKGHPGKLRRMGDMFWCEHLYPL